MFCLGRCRHRQVLRLLPKFLDAFGVRRDRRVDVIIREVQKDRAVGLAGLEKRHGLFG